MTESLLSDKPDEMKKRLKKGLRKRSRQEELAQRRSDRLVWAMEHDPQFRDQMLAQFEAFKAKFGREPGPGDPLIFDPNKDTPMAMSEQEANTMDEQMIAGMIQIGRPEFGYAYARSGYLVGEDNADLIPKEGLKAWNDAVREWRSMSAADRATALQGLVSRIPQ